MAEKDSQVTTDHDTIRNWIEERDGKPARIKDTGGDNSTGILRVDFPGGAEEELETIDWDEFFEQFEQNDLAFLYQEETKDSRTSRFNKFISRDNRPE